MTDTNTSAVSVVSGHLVPAVDNRQDLDLIKKTYAKGLNDNEINLLIAHGNQMGLSVIKKQIYGIKRGDTMSIQVGIDGFRAITESHPDFAGYTEPQWCGPDGQWVDVWLDTNPPAAARIGIYRRGFEKPIWGIATYAEFVQTYFDKYTKKQIPNSMWQKMPANQCLKCAEAQAHRRFNPGVLGGAEIYDEDSPEIETVEAMGVEATVTVTGGDAHEAWNKANRRLRAIASQYNVSDAQLDLYPQLYKKDSFKDLTAQQISALANSMSANPEKIDAYFSDLEAKFGGKRETENVAPNPQDQTEAHEEHEEAYEGEYTEVTDDGEIIPGDVGTGAFQSQLIDLPSAHHGNP